MKVANIPKLSQDDLFVYKKGRAQLNEFNGNKKFNSDNVPGYYKDKYQKSTHLVNYCQVIQ